MKTYIGTKIIEAEPMVRGGNQEQEAEPGYRVRYEDGYESWSPKSVFEKAYKPIDGINFGLAIEAAKMGKRISRAGWNGKGMFVVYQKGYPNGIPCNEQTAKAFGYELGSTFICRPYLQMRCADGTHQMWLASQSDILADDWFIAE
ncbi:DUF2829 domain-containing protein [Papillibacter cinnamivorans]|uniref:Thoeris anti-defense 2-like domain-containing protein n=1 Tax=Papillibacter cinnamivorans DSM 12816 TaxID=1122930 RepID=A0A1W1YRG9_9FIRM|nr:DUF2829 domain-containing protein [Papillibacter cinnamivorans]SMC38308.1 Protein of unknown function [Papillibacter cinnamivorans DSM 12816]